MIDADKRRRTRPRFARVPPPPFHLTERDAAIVREVARYRLLRSDQISALLGAPHKKICGRLTRLYHAGSLDRPRAQIEYHVKQGGSRPMVYCVGPAAAQLGIKIDNHYRQDIGRVFLLHTLAIAAFRVALRLAVRARGDVQLFENDENLASPASPSQDKRLRWNVVVAGDAAVAVVPDLVFTLRGRDGRTRNYLIEIDRGTMPIERSAPHQSSVMRKLLAYEAMRQSALLERRLGWRKFRVVIVASDAARADAIKRAIARSRLAASPLFIVGSLTDDLTALLVGAL